MEQNQFLNTEQKFVLAGVINNNYLKDRFYFTGGTALSAFYLHHRESDYLDFFSLEKTENEVIYELMDSWSKDKNFKFDSRFAEVVYIFNLKFNNGKTLKVDFGYYPHPLMEKGQNINGLEIDSLRDIATNKLLTVSQRTDVKDFVDLYFLLQQYTLWDLTYSLKEKFGKGFDPLLLSADFMKVNDFQTLPRMIKPLTLDELKKYFREEAKKLARRVVE